MEYTTTTTSSASSSLQQPATSTQRHEPQSPRPAPLKVRRDSHMIKKPPVQVRQPVIIYTDTPKVVHANPSEFMSVVQRLTGTPSPSAAPASASSSVLPPLPQQPSFPFPLYGQTQDGATLSPTSEMRNGEGRELPLASILSPVPASLPALPASLFSPLGGAGCGNTVVGGASCGGTISDSANADSTYAIPANLQSPCPYHWDLLDQFKNL